MLSKIKVLIAAGLRKLADRLDPPRAVIQGGGGPDPEKPPK